jgi:hypothetical protein
MYDTYSSLLCCICLCIIKVISRCKDKESIKMKKYYCNCQYNKHHRSVDDKGLCTYCKQEVKV